MVGEREQARRVATQWSDTGGEDPTRDPLPEGEGPRRGLTKRGGPRTGPTKRGGPRTGPTTRGEGPAGDPHRTRDPAGDPHRGEGPAGDPPPEGRAQQGTHTEHTQTPTIYPAGRSKT